MKPFIKFQKYKKCLILFIAGTLCSISALIIYLIDPVNAVLTYQLTLAPGTMAFSLWTNPPIDVFFYVYIFNITNAEAFQSGEEKLKVKEIGPYVYQEFLENGNITWNDNYTISYVPKRTLIFRPDLSIGLPEKDYVTVPNIPMLGISSALYKSGFFINYSFSQLASYLGSEPILNVTAYEYLWGYEDRLVELAGSVVPSYINFHKFGLLDRIYDEGENLLNMNLKGNDDMVNEENRYLSIESINGSPGLSHWGYVATEGNETRPENTICNQIRGASEGSIFPSKIKAKAVFRIYRKAFCRPMPIVFEKEVNREGLPAYQYTLSEDFADPPELNPDNACYCLDGECMKKGLMNLTPCYYKIPTAASLPHFLNADPSLYEGIEGLNPDPEKHSTVIILQPTVGIPLYVHSRLQTNLIMKETVYNYKIKPFNSLTVPLFWTDLVIPSVPDDLILLIRLAVTVMPVVQMLFILALVVAGTAAICWSLVRFIMILQEKRHRASDVERRENADLRLPLGYGQYTAIRILPAIKKITSKTDLFA